MKQEDGEAKGIASLFRTVRTATNAPAIPYSKNTQKHMETAGQDSGELDIELKPQVTSSSATGQREDPPAAPPAETEAVQDWQAELAERVQEFRKRRARLHDTKGDSPDTLDLDFESSLPDVQGTRRKVIEFPSSEELEHQTKPTPGVRSAPRTTGLEDIGSSFQRQDSSGGPEPGPPMPSLAETAPLEIELGPSQGNSLAGIRAGVPSDTPGARLSARFFAGMIDTLVLLLGGAIYALIFWRTGGEFSLQPVELGAAAVAGVFFILLYFAGCTILASGTPGLLWAGLEVTTFEGNPPSLSDCLWRGFGYLVSVSALMLGFIWAAVDADGLTWHDRMSRTFVVPADFQ